MRGFTLIEIMVVVIIVAALAVLAIPTITGQMRSRRTQHAAREIAAIYRNARMRAMGRGSAVLVRFDNTVDPEGKFEVREAVRFGSTDPNCDRLPTSSCTLPTWQPATPDSMVVGQFDAKSMEGIRVVDAAANNGIQSDTGATASQMDLCFSPLGRAFVRYNQTGAFAPLTGVPVVRVARFDADNNAWGILRTVLVVPNGNVRLGTPTGAPPP